MDFTQITSELTQLSGTVLMQVFLILVVLDVLSGFLAAKITQSFSSREATNGIMRQTLRVSVFIAMGYAVTILPGTLQAVCISLQAALIIAYVKSLQENYKKAMNGLENKEEL